MFHLLFIVGLTFLAAGVFIIAFAIPIRETTLGSALLIVGSVAMTGGLIAVGLAATVSELQRLIGTLKARSPAMPRPLRPTERKEGEKRPAMPRMQFPPRPGTETTQSSPTKPAPVANPPQPSPMSHGLAQAGVAPRGPEFLPLQPPQTETLGQPSAAFRQPGPEWMRQAIAEIDEAPKLGAVGGRTESLAPVTGVQENWPHPPSLLQGASDAGERGAAPVVAAPQPRAGEIPSQASIFDQVWPAERRKPVAQTAERGIGASPDQLLQPPDTRAPDPRPAPAPPFATAPRAVAAAPPAAGPLAAGPPSPAAFSPSLAPVRGEARPLSILKSGVIEEMAYTLFSDGSIEAQMPDGTMRFSSVDALRHHLEKSET